jgi:superfamily I DNA and RNA helicase
VDTGAELRALRASLLQDVHVHALRSSRDILVIDLHGSAGGARRAQVRQVLETAESGGMGIRCFFAGQDSTDRNEFWRAGAVTVSDIRRAKGNEAPMVYVIGLEALATSKAGWGELIRARNTFFVALTRAQAWVSLSGVARDSAARALFEEVRRVVGAVQSSSSAIQFEWKRDRGYRDLTHETQAELPLAAA